MVFPPHPFPVQPGCGGHVSRLAIFLRRVTDPSPLRPTYAGAIYAYTCELYDQPPQWGLWGTERETTFLDSDMASCLEDAHSSPANPVPLLGVRFAKYRGAAGYTQLICLTQSSFNSEGNLKIDINSL